MFYEEWQIDGVWHYRATPNGEWRKGRLETQRPEAAAPAAEGDVPQTTEGEDCYPIDPGPLWREDKPEGCLVHLRTVPGCYRCNERVAPQASAWEREAMLQMLLAASEDIDEMAKRTGPSRFPSVEQLRGWKRMVDSIMAEVQRIPTAPAAAPAPVAWQNIGTAEPEFLNNLADKGGLDPLVAGMLRHCARLLAAPTSAATPDDPIRAEVHRVMDEGDGWWKPCSGCHETNEGYETGHYPYSDVFRCHLGGGCTECGGLGAVWEEFPDIAEMEAEARAATPGEAAHGEQGDGFPPKFYVADWRARADHCQNDGDYHAARIFRLCANEIEAALAQQSPASGSRGVDGGEG